MSTQVPAYRRVVDGLRERILSGELKEGDRLPSVRNITETYQVTTGTAARAIAELRAEGLVVTRHGAGAFVRRFQAIRRSSPVRLAKERWGANNSIQDADTGSRPRTIDVEVGEIGAYDWIAMPLGLTVGVPVVFRSRRIVVDDRVVQLATSYLPTDIARGTQIMHTDTGPGGTYARLAEIGLAPFSFTEHLRVRMPLPIEAARLELSGGAPVIEITRHAFTDSERCVEVNRMILDATAYLLDYSFPA